MKNTTTRFSVTIFSANSLAFCRATRYDEYVFTILLMKEKRERNNLTIVTLPSLREEMKKEGERLELNESTHWQFAALVYLRSRNKFTTALAQKFKMLFKTLE